MNIVEAIQRAENGHLITNSILKRVNHFLKYMGSGVFYEYEVIGCKHNFKYEVRNFEVGYILDIGWEIVENNYFKN